MMESNSSNDLHLDDPPPTPLSYRITGIIGIVGILVNILILVIFYHTKHLKSSSVLIGLINAHIANSLSYACFGFWGSLYGPGLVSPLYCIKIFFPNLVITTFGLLPLMLALAGLERLLALVAPVWFRTNGGRIRLWMVVTFEFALGLISMGINWLLAWIQSDHLISDACVPPYVIGKLEIIYMAHIPCALGGICATVCSAVGVYVGVKKIRHMPSSGHGERGRMRRQVKLAKCMLMISCIDVICVVLPNILLVLHLIGSVHFPLRYTAYALTLFGLDSVLNILAFMLFNSEFRKSAMVLLRCGKTKTDPGKQGSRRNTNTECVSLVL